MEANPTLLLLCFDREAYTSPVRIVLWSSSQQNGGHRLSIATSRGGNGVYKLQYAYRIRVKLSRTHTTHAVTVAGCRGEDHFFFTVSRKAAHDADADCRLAEPRQQAKQTFTYCFVFDGTGESSALFYNSTSMTKGYVQVGVHRQHKN